MWHEIVEIQSWCHTWFRISKSIFWTFLSIKSSFWTDKKNCKIGRNRILPLFNLFPFLHWMLGRKILKWQISLFAFDSFPSALRRKAKKARQMTDLGATLFYRKQSALKRFNASISGGLVIKYFYTVIETVFFSSGTVICHIPLHLPWFICPSTKDSPEKRTGCFINGTYSQTNF